MSIRRSFLSFRSTSSSSSRSSVERRIQPHGNPREGKEDPTAGGPAAASGDRWAELLPELLGDIIRRLESSEDRWPVRKNVVSCACVCRQWRHVTTSIVGSPKETGQITFPSSLKQPGPKELPIQCFIKRNKKNSTFYLYLSLTPTFMDKGKFLLAARKFRRGSYTEFIISLDADDLSQGSTAYVGKLRSDFLGTNFTIYDSQPPYDGAKTSNCRASRRFASKQISPQVPAGSFEIGQVSYKFNLLKSRGPRRMLCTMQCPTSAAEEEPPKETTGNALGHSAGSVVLRNKAPRWHEHLQCWCLNFHGRVTVASVKNFQLVAAADPNQAGGATKDDETVLLQFGKVANDLFTMDYRQPLSAFQAFAICLTSFGTKFACE